VAERLSSQNSYSPSPPDNGLGQYVSSPGNRAYCYAELAVSSLAMAVIITSTHFAYPRRDGQAELAWANRYSKACVINRTASVLFSQSVLTSDSVSRTFDIRSATSFAELI